VSEPLLAVEKLHAGYGEVVVLKEVSIAAKKGQVTAVLGSNGAGKTTLLKVIMGIVKPREGRVLLDGKDITGLKPHQVARMGMSMVPEGRRLWGEMTVLENIELGGNLLEDKSKLDENMERVFELFPHLKNLLKKHCRSLSGGEQQMVAIARVLVGDPEVILLDEPSLGLAPIIVAEVFEVVMRLREEGKTVILVEQNANKALEICDFAWVLENGRVRFSGTPDQVEGNEEVRRAYLGL